MYMDMHFVQHVRAIRKLPERQKFMSYRKDGVDVL